LSNTGRVHRNEKGEPVRLAGAVVDITARKEVESALRQQWLTFDTALSNTPDFNYIFDLEGRFLYVNRARLRMFQMSLEQVVGKTFFELPPYSRERAEKFYAQIQQVIRTKETVRDQSPDTGPTGVTRQYEYILVPVLSADGEVEAVAGTTHDITDQKLVEQALRESQEGLKRTNRDLMRVNRELEEFDYVASHDLQEPLRMVNIYTELILREVPAVGTDLAQYAQFVQQGVKRMEGLIRDLLTFSRAVHAEDEPVGRADLSAALGDAISVLQSRIEENGAVIAAGPLPAVRADVSQISHVFQNLLSNALKYRKAQGAVEVRVSAEQNGSDWIVSVADNGIGFEPQYAERIFGLFKRLHKEEYPGTGLGLAICKRIVERHGGRIWAEGQLGHGATFRFSLPGAESPGFHDSQPPGI
jgi:PAS domain S-box-containing protein